jgi:hypothetical protein
MKFVRCFFGILLIACAAAPAGTEKTVSSTRENQTGLEVTVYNNDLGLIKDTRTVELPQGRSELCFMDVAATINPVTVSVESRGAPGQFSVLEQNYEYDLINEEKLLDKYIGKKIKLVNFNQYQDKKETVEATLLSNNNGQVYRINDEIYCGHPGEKVLPKLPDNLVATPTLTWLVSNKSAKPHRLEVSYLASAIGWSADYVLSLDKNDAAGNLSGWVSVDNNSGAMYKDARLKLVAGEVNRVSGYDRDKVGRLSKAKADFFTAEAPRFEEKAFFEYHIYDLAGTTTLKDKQKKQIRLLEAPAVKVKKEFLINDIANYTARTFRDQKEKKPVNVFVSFFNSKENGCGMPLPAGTMRIYKKDAGESLQFVGEDRIEHTPKDETVRLKIGEAFDIVAEKTQTDFKELSSKLYESEWEITIRNHKDQDVSVGIVEPVGGNWKITQNNRPFKKLDAFTIRFDVSVPKDQSATVIYRIQVGL